MLQCTTVLVVVALLLLVSIVLLQSRKIKSGNEAYQGWCTPTITNKTRAPLPALVPQPQLPLYRMYNPQTVAAGLCSSYNQDQGPRQQQDCPDSSFTYVNDLTRVTGRLEHHFASCVQAKRGNNPWCYSLPDGTYVPNWDMYVAVSP